MSLPSTTAPTPTSTPQPETTRTIALIDSRWNGHHPTFFKEMTQALLLAGYRVLGACPAPEEMMTCVRQELFPDRPDLHSKFHAFLFRDSCGLIANTPLENDPITVRRRWNEATHAVRRAQTELGWEIDMVFFAWLDTFLKFGLIPSLPNCLGVPWSGLYFFSHHLKQDHSALFQWIKGDHLLENSSCQTVGLLDERSAEVIEKRHGITPIVFPDITNEEVSETPTRLAEEVREMAEGRFTIGMISLEARKGFIPLLRVAMDSADRNWYFVFTGPYKKSWFTKEELAFIHESKRAIEAGEATNIYLNLDGDRIPDGVEYNGLCETFDLMPALYPGWQGSSNALTKAAVLEKLVLSWNGGCIGPRVEKYELGLTADAEDLPQIKRAIECLEKGTDETGKTLNPKFEAYRRFHSREQLAQCFDQVFDRTVPAKAGISSLVVT